MERRQSGSGCRMLIAEETESSKSLAILMVDAACRERKQPGMGESVVLAAECR
jgi:hypothetical protein